MLAGFGPLLRGSALQRAPALLRCLASDAGRGESLQERIVSIDRSGLMSVEEHSHEPQALDQANGELLDHIRAVIRFRGGPITIAEYMSEALTNPTAGYYSTREVFGRAGDFITSPDISQLFGEMIGIWCVLQWQQLRQPRKLRVVELGPGRGTLMADMLRSTTAFPEFSSSLSVSLVEVSMKLREQQAAALQCTVNTSEGDGRPSSSRSGLGSQPQVTWHSSLEDVPQDAPTLIIAHEFFDALPVHQFQRTPLGWREILVDAARASDDAEHGLRFVLAPGATPASHLLLPRRLQALAPTLRDSMQHIEVSGQAMAAAGQLAQHVTKLHQGAAIVIDYGQDAPYANSLQAILSHAPAHPLQSPGHCDLSCRVDFDALRQGVAESKAEAKCWGPQYQGEFLQNLGIAARLEALLDAAENGDQQEALYRGAMRIVTGPRPSSSSHDKPESHGGAGVSGREDTEGGASGAHRGERKGKAEEEEQGAEDGLGYQYMAMAITPADMSPSAPFAPG